MDHYPTDLLAVRAKGVVSCWLMAHYLHWRGMVSGNSDWPFRSRRIRMRSHSLTFIHVLGSRPIDRHAERGEFRPEGRPGDAEYAGGPGQVSAGMAENKSEQMPVR